MKTSLLSLSLIVGIFTSHVSAMSVLLFEDFEDNATLLTSASNADLEYVNIDDYFAIVPLSGAVDHDDGPIQGVQGNNYFAAEDLNALGFTGPNAGSATRTLVFELGISDVIGDLSFSGLFAAGSNDLSVGDGNLQRYDFTDGLRVRAQIDNGVLQDLFSLQAANVGGDNTNQALRFDTNFDGTGDGALVTNTLTSSGEIPIVGTGNVLLLLIEISSDSTDEDFALDNIMITGTAVPEPTTALLASLFLGVTVFRRRR